MSLIYSEGYEKALRRLKREIGHLNSDEAGHSGIGKPPPFLLPLERNPRFTGRELELALLEEALTSKGDFTARASLVGLGGVGKTQLAIEMAHRLARKEPECSVFWIPVTDLESMLQAYRAIADHLNLPGRDGEGVDLRLLLQAHLSSPRAGQWLLIFDNADDLSMWIEGPIMQQSAKKMIDCLPKSSQGRILFTTRDRRVAVKLSQQNTVQVSMMEWRVAAELFRKCLPKPDTTAENAGLRARDEADVQTLVTQLEALPLAIVQAAAYIDANQISIADFLSLLAEQEETMIELLSEDFEDLGRYRNIHNPIATTWLISFQRIREHDELAVECLSFMACIEPKNIPIYLLPLQASPKKALEAIGTLAAYSFVTKDSTKQSMNIHRLVQLVTRNWLAKENLLEACIHLVILHITKVFPTSHHTNRAIWRSYMPHAQHALRVQRSSAPIERSNLLYKYGCCLARDGRYIEAETAFNEDIKIKREEFRDEHLGTLESICCLAEVYCFQARYPEAERLHTQVLKARELILDKEHPDILAGECSLASVYTSQGRLDEAQQLHAQVLAVRQRVRGDEHPDTLISMTCLSTVYALQGRNDMSEQIIPQVLERRKRVLSDEHPNTLASMENLAIDYIAQNRLDEAEALVAQVLSIRARDMGEEHLDTLRGISNLAYIRSLQKRFTEAADLLVQLLGTQKRVLGEEHYDTLATMHQLGYSLKRLGRENDAYLVAGECYALTKRVQGEDHPNTLAIMQNLAISLKDLGRSDDGIALMRDCLSLRTRLLGAVHEHTVVCADVLKR